MQRVEKKCFVMAKVKTLDKKLSEWRGGGGGKNKNKNKKMSSVGSRKDHNDA